MDFTGFMAAFALAAFWLNTLLIAAAGWSECAALRRLYGDLSAGTGDRAGRVLAGVGPDGALATWRVVQVGRCNGRGPILFHDRSRVSRVFGGTIEVGGVQVEPAEGAEVEVWIGAAARRRALVCPDAGAFAAAGPAATRAAGWERVVELPLRAGDAIWLASATNRVDRGNSLRVLADFEPARWTRRVTLWTVALVLGLVAVAGACTALCLWPPVFGVVSKVGALAALVAFNLFQLLGKMHHDAIQPPALAVLGGAWKRPR